MINYQSEGDFVLLCDLDLILKIISKCQRNSTAQSIK